jgi:KUP system potassium uptake protein
MAVWFATLAVAGLVHLVHYPRVLLALSPNYALAYAGHVGAGTTFAVLGSVFLALTGGEALYADMGHFGRSAIRISWFAFVLPALVLVYLGQGALVLADPASANNPFFLLFPNWLLVPAVLLTTAATVIASQAVLSGAFALVQQAINSAPFHVSTCVRPPRSRLAKFMFLKSTGYWPLLFSRSSLGFALQTRSPTPMELRWQAT